MKKHLSDFAVAICLYVIVSAIIDNMVVRLIIALALCLAYYYFVRVRQEKAKSKEADEATVVEQAVKPQDFAETFGRAEIIKGICFFLFYGLSLLIASLLFELIDSEFVLNNPDFLYYAVMFVFAIALFYKVLVTAFMSIRILHITPFIVITLITVVLNVTGSLITDLFGVVNENQIAVDEEIARGSISFFLALVLLAPFVEEIIFRFFVFRLIRKYSFILAHFVSAFLFGFIHVWVYVFLDGNPVALLAMFPTFFMGLGLSAMYEKTKTLALPIVLHMLINLIF